MSDQLAAHIRAAGDPIPAGVVNGIAAQVAEVSGLQLPSTVALKRTFITNWYAEVGGKVSSPANSRAGSHRSNGSAPSPSRSAASTRKAAPKAATPPQVNRDELLRQLAPFGGVQI